MDRQHQSDSAVEDAWDEDQVDTRVQVAELTAELQDKEDLIHALTSQLEQAVDQLDRIHREGGDRGGRTAAATGGVAGEFVEEQRYVNDRVSQWLDSWDQQQPFDLWNRIEQRIEEIVQRGIAAPAAPSFNGFETPTAPIKEPDNSDAAWEEAKRKLLGDMSFGESSTAPAASQAEPPISLGDISYPDPIDVDTAEHVVLIDAVEVRDRYIAYLTQRLRALEMQGPANWEAMNNAPEELRTRLEQLEADYREHLRREECDMALERARLAREQNRLKQDRHKLEVQARKLGFASDEFKLPPPVAGELEGDDRSWRKMFGRKK
ncbi:hypothetical protein Pan44_00420 [Caulifigura coniformis]|uniref:Uncharacterized protein n=1 Tax=Caulifigura coniformis TaxID=2527983 RepID=A0A517S7F2_9PLAN|nr:hypothetical protein [Caulifigura coniformis]QDT52035.1 hypothetical protein Pan44_00420 [Caulifigura coniformis]